MCATPRSAAASILPGPMQRYFGSRLAPHLQRGWCRSQVSLAPALLARARCPLCTEVWSQSVALGPKIETLRSGAEWAEMDCSLVAPHVPGRVCRGGRAASTSPKSQIFQENTASALVGCKQVASPPTPDQPGTPTPCKWQKGHGCLNEAQDPASGGWAHIFLSAQERNIWRHVQQLET